MSQTDRSMVSELRKVRNDYAHEKPFSYDDTDRALDSIRRLLHSCGSAAEAKEVGELRKDLIRVQFREEARKETRKAVAVEGDPTAGLKAWREVVTPHEDVASGRYQQAEFAADLAEVQRGEGSSEYSDPREFYSRTFITDGLKDLLTGALTRLTGQGGDPVVELKTNFGGGKTHSMLALYHLVSGESAEKLPGIDEIARKLEVTTIPKANRAVLVGTDLGPAQKRTKPGGIETGTLWGEMAWQLGGAEGYKLIEESDKRGTSPGKERLKNLFDAFSPCLVLIDEWVAFVRQLYKVDELPAGSYEANLTFAQALTEAAKSSKNSLVVASLPVSDIEIGGEAGRYALDSLTNVFKRIAKPWRPASADEGFEIVRRRLFQSQIEYPARDAVVKAFSDMYRQQGAEFPSECREADYKRKLEACYPIHPELFDRLDQDWATLDKFQRTRGVLRLMAAVIHELWDRHDKNLMIMPSSIPLDAPKVMSLVSESLPDQWDGVISKDVDGPHSLPQSLDSDNPNLGRYSAARRVARTVFMGSAPTLGSNNPGIEDRLLRLGCAQPGEAVATFGDALRRLTDQATYLYVDKARRWYALQASVTRLAKDRAETIKGNREDALAEIVKRLRQEKDKGDFEAIHIAPMDGSEVPDEMEARLVVLKPELTHSRKATDSPALAVAREILEKKGNSPRLYRNALVFLAPDKTRLRELEESVCQYLAWKSINDDGDSLDLTAFARNQVKTKMEENDKASNLRIHETWSWCLVPGQPNSREPEIEWPEFSIPGGDALAKKVCKKLINDEGLFPVLGAPRLKMELDRHLWAEVDSFDIKRLWECFASYLYMPRLINRQTLVKAVESGFTGGMFCEYFAYATGYDEARKRYTGLQPTLLTTGVEFDGSSLLVKSDAAGKQAEEEKKAAEASATGSVVAEPSNGGYGETAGGEGNTSGETASGEPEPPALPKRFFGSVKLNPDRLGRDAGKIAEEVLQHLTTLTGANVKVTLDIHAELPDGVEESVQRVVIENANTLGFENKGFEQS